MKIIDLLKDDKNKINQTATLLHESFEAWGTLELAINEVIESLQENRISRVLMNDKGVVIGWIGGQSQYNGNVWEIHPLVINKAYRRNGFGKMLVNDFEKQVAQRGGVTILLGSDDENNQTNVSNQNLYSELPSFIENFYSEAHPINFYLKLGFIIIGIIPDANGIGKPDILMAKQVK
ncbi:aminoglycoside N-acetyltransferase AAC(6')-Ii [Paenibacillus sp. J23TS9]|uniref:GNAT family N-acetyltransferase n=1 Tax=Paenibacillus sp. J23TS9 TaxID=2807193 RepID=UPI001B1154A9|nr:GNAT family N-acetyltransferase [Paenibacillus sp. J23TS9]GIP29409.1 aminoglycoside N-acetyltransferase AAC(6')-Ii [Paenibacillus sp. J23TS9]